MLIRKKVLTAFVVLGSVLCFGKFSRSRTVCTTVFIACCLGASIASAYISRQPEFEEWSKHKSTMVVWLTASVATDNIVCLSLLLYLVSIFVMFDVWARLMIVLQRKRGRTQSATLLWFITGTYLPVSYS